MRGLSQVLLNSLLSWSDAGVLLSRKAQLFATSTANALELSPAVGNRPVLTDPAEISKILF